MAIGECQCSPCTVLEAIDPHSAPLDSRIGLACLSQICIIDPMKTTKDLRDALNACKGTGRWGRIAAVAGCDYNNLTRIARGESAPSLDFGVKLFAAIDATAPRADDVTAQEAQRAA